MPRPVTSTPGRCSSTRPRGFTLVEMLIATALTLLMMAAVVSMFGAIGNSVQESRAILEMTDRMRGAAARLQMDLAGATCTPLPPRRPEANEGYIEIIEGPIGTSAPMTLPQTVAVDNSSGTPTPEASATGTLPTVGDFDDILMLTTHTTGKPFVGSYHNPVTNTDTTIESDLAEVAWFVRGRTLYRRVLLIAPGAISPGSTVLPAGFYLKNDISVHVEGSKLVANTLGDLTDRKNRFAHSTQAPYDARGWGMLGLPTLCECSSSGWMAGNTAPPSPMKYANQIDFWATNFWSTTQNTGFQGWNVDLDGTMTNYASGQRVADDVILTHVIGFDVKVYEPSTGQYKDLGWNNDTCPTNPVFAAEQAVFAHKGDSRSLLDATGAAGTAKAARVYDTWSTQYEQTAGKSANGFDDGSGMVDGATEAVYAPPYPAPLRSIQIKIRCFEPDSRQIREVTVVQDFLPK